MPVESRLSLGIGGTNLSLPAFFPSISSVKANFQPLDFLRLLVGVNYPLCLISAYDIFHAALEDRNAITDCLHEAHRYGTIVLLDSGNYESFWKNDSSWSLHSFADICSLEAFHIVFSFDNPKPEPSLDSIVEWAVASCERAQAFTQKGTVIPIVHSPRELFPNACYRIAEILYPPMIAVPERSLGEGMFERAETIVQLRRSLNRLPYYCPLHLLGTGNPMSILVYAACGADSFDGLEWCQTAVDHSTGTLFHFQHWDFFRNQTPLGKLKDVPYGHAVMAHNLLFYTRWLADIRESLITGKMPDLLSRWLPLNAAEGILRRLKEAF